MRPASEFSDPRRRVACEVSSDCVPMGYETDARKTRDVGRAERGCRGLKTVRAPAYGFSLISLTSSVCGPSRKTERKAWQRPNRNSDVDVACNKLFRLPPRPSEASPTMQHPVSPVPSPRARLTLHCTSVLR